MSSSKKRTPAIPAILCGLILVFILLISLFLIPEFSSDNIHKTFPFIAILGFVFLLLGIILTVLTLKRKIKGKLKLFLLLTGVSAVSPLVFSILHNLFYALAVITSDIILLKTLMEFLHATFFIIGLVFGPIGFLIGAVGSIVLIFRKKR